MNKLSVLFFSLVVVAFSAFSTASAQDLKASWIEYENARSLLAESYVQIDAAWVLATDGWANGPRASVGLAQESVAATAAAWAEIDAARAVIASTFKITLTDSETRITRLINPRVRPQVFRNSGPLPWTPEPTWGSWEELNQAWASMDQAWVEANNAWAELDSAWAGIAEGNEIAVSYWATADGEWAKVNAAWAEIDAVWASKQ